MCMSVSEGVMCLDAHRTISYLDVPPPPPPQGVTIDNSGTKGFYISGEPVFVDTVSSF